MIDCIEIPPVSPEDLMKIKMLLTPDQIFELMMAMARSMTPKQKREMRDRLRLLYSPLPTEKIQ